MCCDDFTGDSDIVAEDEAAHGCDHAGDGDVEGEVTGVLLPVAGSRTEAGGGHGCFSVSVSLERLWRLEKTELKQRESR